MATKTRATQPTRRAAMASKATSTPLTPDTLADALKTNLRITGAKKPTRKAPDAVISPSELMRRINSSSTKLSALVKGGSKGESDAVVIRGLGEACLTALEELRKLGTKPLDVERSAISVVSKLVTLEQYDVAVGLLSGMKPAVERICCQLDDSQRVEDGDSLQYVRLHIPNRHPTDDVHCTLIAQYLSLSLATLAYTLFSVPSVSKSGASNENSDASLDLSLDTALSSNTLLHWLPALLPYTPSKQYNGHIMRTYSFLTQSSSSRSQSHPRTVFSIRLFGLMCLLKTTDGTVEPDTFWGQAIKLFVTTMQRLVTPHIGDGPGLVPAFAKVEQAVNAREDAAKFFSSPLFVKFAECRLECATKMGDVQELQRISRTARTTPGSSSAGALSTESTSPALDALGVCAILVQATNRLEETLSDSAAMTADDAWLAQDQPHILGALARASYLMVLKEDGHSTSIASLPTSRGANQVRRSVENLRRASIKVLDDPNHCRDQVLLSAARNFLEGIIDALEGAAAKRAAPELLTPLLETIFTLARGILDPLKPDTHQASYQLLCRTLAIPVLSLQQFLDPKPSTKVPEDNFTDLGTVLNYQRCISSAFFNPGAALYRASKFAAAIRFIRIGCQIGAHSLSLHHASEEARKSDLIMKDAQSASNALVPEQTSDSDRTNPWAQLEEQLYPRWDLLGSCCVKTGDRQLAYDAFVEAITSFPLHRSGFIALTSGREAKSVFEASAVNQQLSLSIDRATYLAANELMMPPDGIPLADSLMRSSGLARSDKGSWYTFVGCVLEKQLAVLEVSKWKPRVQAALPALLDKIADAYKSAARPVRAARCMVKHIALSYSISLGDGKPPLGALEELARLSEMKDLADDASLSHLIPLYQATGHLWMVLHAHKELSRDEALKHASLGLEILGTILHKDTPAPEKSMSKQATTVRGRARRVVAAAKSSGSKTTRAPVTPTNSPGIRPDGPKPNMPSADYSEVLDLLMTVSIVVNMLGALPLRIGALSAVCKLSEVELSLWGDYYVQAAIELVQEHLAMGQSTKAATICAQVVEKVKDSDMSDEVRVRFLLQRAELLAPQDDLDQSVIHYLEASEAAGRIVEDDTGGSTSARLAVKVKQIERVALAAHAFAAIQHGRDDPLSGIEELLHALRLWNRAARMLTRLGPSKSTAIEDPFAVDTLKDTLPQIGNDKVFSSRPQPSQKPLLNGENGLDAAQWRVAQGTLETLLALAHAYFMRGSVKEAEYFAQQAQDLAEAVSAHLMIARAVLQRAEIQVSMSKIAEATELLDKADVHLKDAMVVDHADALRLRGVCKGLSQDEDSARECYENASSALGKIERTLEKLESVKPQKDPAEQVVEFAPAIVASILRRHAWLMREDAGDRYEQLLERLSALPDSTEVQAELHAIIGKLTLDEAFSQCKSDMFLSSIAESTIAMPMGMSNDKPIAQSPATQDVLAVLANAEQLFLADLGLLARRGNVSHVREAAVSLAMITSLRTSMGASSPQAPLLAARLLDISSSITLSREMLESIKLKHPEVGNVDDMRWPSMDKNGVPLPPAPSKNHKKRTKIRQLRFESDDEGSDEEENDSMLKEYWASVGERFSEPLLDPENPTPNSVEGLPEHWVVVHMSITEDNSTMFVSRQQAGREPLVFCLPLKGRRESEDDAQLGFDDAVDELADIIRASDESTRGAVRVAKDDRDARAAWWAERGALDKRLKALVENIEFCWLGGFKAVLARPGSASPQELADLGTRIEGVFRRALRLRESRARLALPLVECVAALAPKSRDEELEDVVYFVLDLYQAHGVPVVLSEVDVDQAVIELRMALEEHAARAPPPAADDSHLFLVLDKNLQGLPWESTPVLRGRSVSRVPNLAFLHDRVDLARRRQGAAPDDAPVDRAVVDPRKTYFMLNPSGDLKGTEARFARQLQDMKAVGWAGIVGRAPSEQEFLDALGRHDLVVYFGHGGGEQYVRSHKIRHLPRCAATMLWGCSSGHLRAQGAFDRTGTPYHYMLAGCPTLVASLWDVTDRDLDKFTQSVFDRLALTPAGVRSWQNRAQPHSVVEAVAEARDVCKLKYLTGAAPVVYGIPFYL